MSFRGWASVLLLVARMACAQNAEPVTVEEEVSSLIGLEYTALVPNGTISSRLSCVVIGGGFIATGSGFSDEWAESTVNCQGRLVKVLERLVGNTNGYPRWRIVDAVLLPPVELDFDPARPDALRLYGNESCEATGLTESMLIVVARFRGRDQIDWRSGVEQAWVFDLKRGRIVPISSRRVVCERVEP